MAKAKKKQKLVAAAKSNGAAAAANSVSNSTDFNALTALSPAESSSSSSANPRYAVVYRRNQFKLFDSAGAAEHTHVDKAEVYSALSWARKESGAELLLLGCKSGRVQAFETAGGEATLVAELGGAAKQGEKKGEEKVVRDLAYHRLRHSVFVCYYGSADVAEFDLDSGKLRQAIKGADKVGVARLACSDKHVVVAGEKKVKAFLISDGSCSDKFPAPLSTASSVSVRGGFVAVCDGSNAVALYRLGHEGFSSSLVSGKTLGLQHGRFLEAEGTGSFKFAALAANREQAVLWSFSEGGVKSKKPVPSCVSVEGGSKPLLALPAFLEKKGALVFACGALSAPQFATESVKGKLAAGAAHHSATLFAVAAAAAPAAAGAKAEKRGRDEAAATEEAASKRQKKANGATVGTVVGVTKAARPSIPVKFAEGKDGADDETMQKTRSILDQLQKAYRAQKEGDKGGRVKLTSLAGIVSIAPLITQVLKTKDPNVLQVAMQVVDKRVINNTVRDLTGQQAFDWMQECSVLLFKNPGKAFALIEWIKAVTMSHCGYILANERLKAQLEALYKNLSDRLESQESLLKVQGKLELLIATATERIRVRNEALKTHQEPLISYQEGPADGKDESSDEESEDGEAESTDGSSDPDMDDFDFDEDLLGDDDAL